MTPKMNPEVKAKWTAALRSGEYTQGKNQLKTATGKFCCLGVLCDLHAKETGGEWQLRGEDGESYGKAALALPPVVREWATLPSSPMIETPELHESLMNLNDGGKSFAEIADLIDAHL